MTAWRTKYGIRPSGERIEKVESFDWVELCTGVAVARSKLFVCGAIRWRNASRLFGLASPDVWFTRILRRRARCASASITHSECMFARCSVAAVPRVTKPVDTIPTRREQRLIASSPVAG